MGAVIFMLSLTAFLLGLVVWSSFTMADNDYPDADETAMWQEINAAFNRPGKDVNG